MRIVRIAAAIAILVATGIVHGSWTNRWKSSTALAELAARVEAVPMDVGRWKGSPIEMGERELAEAGAIGHLSRQYRDSESNLGVTTLVVCGLPGDISSHTPDVCYPGSGFELSPPSRYVTEIGSPPQRAEFLTSIARRDGPEGSEALRIFWAWNDGQGWRAPKDPRWTFVDAPALTKIYVIRDGAEAGTAPEDDPCNEFIEQFLPDLDPRLFDAFVRESQHSG